MRLIIIAHPDDELLWAWPLLQEGHCAVLAASDNHNTYGQAGRKALREACKRADCWALDPVGLPNNYYRTPTRNSRPTLMEAVRQIDGAIWRAVEKVTPDIIYTHNPWGEYGHGDHRLLHDIVLRHPAVTSLWTSDMAQPNMCHIAPARARERLVKTWGAPVRMHCTLDHDWYEHTKRAYVDAGAWSWTGHDVTDTCQLYAI